MSNRNKKNFRQREAGQSTVEFTLTLILLVGFIMFFFQLAMVLGFSNYAQYATFMSARAYLAAGSNREDQQTRARNVIATMLKRSASSPQTDRMPTIAKGVGGGDLAAGLDFDSPQYNAQNKDFSWLQGIRYTFKGRIFVLPIGKGLPQASGQNSVTLSSEAFLGREPSSSECQEEMTSRRDGGIFDNGC